MCLLNLPQQFKNTNRLAEAKTIARVAVNEVRPAFSPLSQPFDEGISRHLNSLRVHFDKVGPAKTARTFFGREVDSRLIAPPEIDRQVF